MSVLEGRLAEYLLVRRQLGYKLELHGRLLADFVTFLNTVGAQRITTELALQWATRPGASARYHPAQWGQVQTVVPIRGRTHVHRAVVPRAGPLTVPEL
jgi:hypothetical protein